MFKRLKRFIQDAGIKSSLMSGFPLMGVILLSVANVVFRRFGNPINGTYEITEMVMAVVVAAAFVHTTLDHGHVVVMSVVSRLQVKIQNVLYFFSLIIQFLYWAVITWASIGILSRNWLREETDSLEIPVLPFRFIWVLGLVFLCIIIFEELFRRLLNHKKEKN